MPKVTNIQKYLLLPLSKIIIKCITRFQLFKLILTLFFLGGYVFCYYLLDFRRCGLVPKNIVYSGLVFYLLDLAQHLITFQFAEELVHKIFSKHHPYKLETWYTLKSTFTVTEIIYFILTFFNLGEFTICTRTKVFITSYIAVYLTIHMLIFLILACCGQMLLESAKKLEDLAQTVLYKAFNRGVEAIGDYVEDKLEPLNMILEGRERITERNRDEVWKDDLIKNYEMLEMPLLRRNSN